MKVTYFGLSKLASAIDCCRLHFVALQKGLAFFFFFWLGLSIWVLPFFLKKIICVFPLNAKRQVVPKKKIKRKQKKKRTLHVE